MPDEVAVAVAPGGAGGSSDVGGAGGGSGSPAAPQGPLTDEQILGIDPVGTAPAEESPVLETEQKPAEQQPAEGATKTPEQEAAAKVEEDGRLMPVKWRELAKSDPEFRTLFYTSKANAEKLAQIEPKFKEFETAIAETQRADQAYLSGDPIAIQGELKTFLGEKPEALLPMYQAGENLLKELMPQEYEQISTERTVATLKGWQFDRAFEVLRAALDKGDEGTPLLREQVAKMLEFADGNGFPTTEKARVEARARELDQREAVHRQNDEQNYNRSTQAFREAVNSKINESIEGEIKTALGKLLEKTAFTDGAKTRIAAEAHTELNKMLAQNTGIVDQVGKSIWPNGSKDKDGKPVRGAFNDANRELAIRLPVDYAKSVMNDVLQKVIETYTKDFMASHQAAEKRMAAAAGKTEVSGGSPAPRGQRPLTKKDIDYSKQSDEDILSL